MYNSCKRFKMFLVSTKSIEFSCIQQKGEYCWSFFKKCVSVLVTDDSSSLFLFLSLSSSMTQELNALQVNQRKTKRAATTSCTPEPHQETSSTTISSPSAANATSAWCWKRREAALSVRFYSSTKIWQMIFWNNECKMVLLPFGNCLWKFCKIVCIIKTTQHSSVPENVTNKP